MWHDGIDRWSKTAIGCTGALFAAGMLIENIQLQIIGVHDASVASVVQGRFVLVGLAFVIYLAIPALLLIAPVLTFQFIRRFLNDRIRIPLIGALVVLLLLFLITPSPIQYFSDELAAKSTMRDRLICFWAYFVDPTLLLRLLLLYLPAVLLVTMWGTLKRRSAWRRGLYVLMSLGVVSTVVQYVVNVYPNLSRSVGGGCPLIAEIDLKNGTPLRPSDYWTMPGVPMLLAGIKSTTQPIPPDYGGTDSVFPSTRGAAWPPAGEPVLLWHENDKFVFVSRLSHWDIGAIVMAIPKDDVAQIRYRRAVLDFHNGSLRHATVPPDMAEIFDAELKMGLWMRQLLREHAATQPSIMTPALQDVLTQLDEMINAGRENRLPKTVKTKSPQ